jgi:hypothetical protein
VPFHASDYRWWVWLLQGLIGVVLFLVAAFLGFLFSQSRGKVLGWLFWLAALFFAAGTVMCFVFGIMRLVG